ncbi:MAG: thiamine pyrophosphate-dependent enzyme [Candidatus Kapaibacterium sp.]
MAQTVSDVLVDILHKWNVDIVFGMPGDGINGVFEALRKRKDDIRFVQVRHEESAAFMAAGYAKYTGKLGVCVVTAGPGGIHLLNGLYDAKFDGAPVLAITGAQFHDLTNQNGQQDVPLDMIFQDVSEYNVRVMGPAHIENAMHLACRTALGKKGVAHVTIPVDIQSMPFKNSGTQRNVPRHMTNVFAERRPVPDEESIRAAANILNDGKRIAILAGRGALGAGNELEDIAETLQAPIIKALLGKAAVPDDSPYTTGGIGLLGTKPTYEVIKDCDTLLIVGSSFPYMEFYPKPGQAKCVQIDSDPTRIGLRYPVDEGLTGDSRTTLKALKGHLKKNRHKKFLKEAQKSMEEWNDLMKERGTRNDKPMKPQVLAWQLGQKLKDDAIVACDSGTITVWWARHIPVKKGQMHTVSGTMASMACGLPYAIGAQAEWPERQVVALVGDGGFSMLMADLVTAVKYKLPVKIFVVKNNSLAMIKWEQMVFGGNPEYGCELEPIDFAAFARACGAAGYTVDDPEKVPGVIDDALNNPGPVVVEAVVDPYEPPYPAHITKKQALKMAEALAKGEPNREKIAWTMLSDKVREMI